MPMTMWTKRCWTKGAIVAICGAALSRASAAEPVDSFPEVPVAPGQWSESKLYRFRVERIESCGPAPTGTPSRFKGETSWVGVFFTVEAKEPEVYVSPRDIELRRGGVILSSSHAPPPTLPDCKPTLTAKRLRPGESVAGFALFEVPGSFRKRTDDPIVISYRPTRWGGARRAEVPIPECLDACPRAWVGQGAKAGNRPSRASRRRL